MWASLACLCLIGACLIKTCPQRRKCLEQTCQLIKLWGLAIAEQIIVQSKFWSKFTVFALVSSPSRYPTHTAITKLEYAYFKWMMKVTTCLWCKWVWHTFWLYLKFMSLIFRFPSVHLRLLWDFQYSSHQASANEISFDKTTLLTPQVLK